VSDREALAFKMENWKVLEQYAREAATNGAELVITPEFATVGYPDIPELPPEEDEYRNPEDIRPYVETVPGPATEYFGKLAKELKIYLHIGLPEVDPVTNAYYNTVVALNPNGEIAAKFRKINLYTGENNFLQPGTDIATYDSPFGKVGIIICADVYSSNPMTLYKDAGAGILALSTSWAQWNTGMNYFKRGAIRNSAFLLAANQNYFPDSGVVNPDGTTQSHIRQSDGVAYGYLPRLTPAPTPVPVPIPVPVP
jgi:predicted amidohydrolase